MYLKPLIVIYDDTLMESIMISASSSKVCTPSVGGSTCGSCISSSGAGGNGNCGSCAGAVSQKK